jgi:hypothetical protein
MATTCNAHVIAAQESSRTISLIDRRRETTAIEAIELLGFLERQTEMLHAGGVFLQDDEVCHRFFTAIVAAYDQRQFDAQGEFLRFG